MYALYLLNVACYSCIIYALFMLAQPITINSIKWLVHCFHLFCWSHILWNPLSISFSIFLSINHTKKQFEYMRVVSLHADTCIALNMDKTCRKTQIPLCPTLFRQQLLRLNKKKNRITHFCSQTLLSRNAAGSKFAFKAKSKNFAYLTCVLDTPATWMKSRNKRRPLLRLC